MKKFIINEKVESDVITIDLSAILHLITFSEGKFENGSTYCCLDCDSAEVAKFISNSFEDVMPLKLAGNNNRIYLQKTTIKFLTCAPVDEIFAPALVKRNYTYTVKDGVLFINIIKHTYYRELQKK